MATATYPIPELQDIARSVAPARRAAAIRQISELFVQGSELFGADHVALFDGILLGLLPQTEIAARAELAERLATLVNAPPRLVGELARADQIAVAGPLLRSSPLIVESVLVELARSRGQDHLLAISERQMVSAAVTDLVIRRGDRDVVRRLAGNAGAQFSEAGYGGLLKRATDDGMLAIAVGQREDLSASQLNELLATSVDLVRRRLFAQATPSRKAVIAQAMTTLSEGKVRPVVRRDFTSAQRAIIALHRAGQLDESTLFGFAKAHQYEEAIVALAAMARIPVAMTEGLFTGPRIDSILVLGKSLDLAWPTVRAIVVLRLGPNRVPAETDIENARLNFQRLVPVTAQRMLAFWRSRHPA
ncbi:MAG TPA: DUF2336 domain-containing protein [Xanthobacteraceae bacterium]